MTIPNCPVRSWELCTYDSSPAVHIQYTGCLCIRHNRTQRNLYLNKAATGSDLRPISQPLTQAHGNVPRFPVRTLDKKSCLKQVVVVMEHEFDCQLPDLDPQLAHSEVLHCSWKKHCKSPGRDRESVSLPNVCKGDCTAMSQWMCSSTHLVHPCQEPTKHRMSGRSLVKRCCI
jgi:hypothetical protein